MLVSSAGVGPALGAYGCDVTGEGGREGGCVEFGFQACSGNSPQVKCHFTLLDHVVPQTRNLDSSAPSVDEEADPKCLPLVLSAYSPPLPLKQRQCINHIDPHLAKPCCCQELCWVSQGSRDERHTALPSGSRSSPWKCLAPCVGCGVVGEPGGLGVRSRSGHHAGVMHSLQGRSVRDPGLEGCEVWRWRVPAGGKLT